MMTVRELLDDRNMLQRLVVALVMKAGGDVELDAETMAAARNGVGILVTEDDDGGVEVNTFIADEYEAS